MEVLIIALLLWGIIGAVACLLHRLVLSTTSAYIAYECRVENGRESDLTPYLYIPFGGFIFALRYQKYTISVFGFVMIFILELIELLMSILMCIFVFISALFICLCTKDKE